MDRRGAGFLSENKARVSTARDVDTNYVKRRTERATQLSLKKTSFSYSRKNEARIAIPCSMPTKIMFIKSDEPP